METVESFSCPYVTVNPLTTPTPPPDSTDSEAYVVFRNEISASSLQSASLGTAAVDFFSQLDVDAENVVAPPIPTLSKPSKEVEEKDRKLEGTWFRANSRFKSPMLQLHKEIVDFTNFLSPTPDEEASRDEAIKSVFHVIKYIWPNCKVEVFGSFKTGLYLPTSDIDVVILGSNIKKPKHGLLALSRVLSQKQIAEKIQVIAGARVPIIKFVEKKSGIPFDISFDMQNGPKGAEFIKNAVSQWPPLRPLCLLLKIFLQQRRLNEVYTGGIGSYALLVMLITALQTYHKSGDSLEHNLGVLLVYFFDLYGCRLNTSDVGISCLGGGTFFSKSSRGFTSVGKQPRISIEDPQSTETDIGKSSFNYFMVKSAFATAFKTLTNEKTIMGLEPNKSILGTIIQPDASLLERKGVSSRNLAFKDLIPAPFAAGDPLPQQEDGDVLLLHCSNGQLNDEARHQEDNIIPQVDDASASASASVSHSSENKRETPKVKKTSVRKTNETADKDSWNICQKRRKICKEKEKGGGGIIKKVGEDGNGRILRSGKNWDGRILRSGKKC